MIPARMAQIPVHDCKLLVQPRERAPITHDRICKIASPRLSPQIPSEFLGPTGRSDFLISARCYKCPLRGGNEESVSRGQRRASSSSAWPTPVIYYNCSRVRAEEGQMVSIKWGAAATVAFVMLECAGVFAQALPQEGRPVTADDISGKRVCWSNGRMSIFLADGQYKNDRGQHATWSVSQPGVIHINYTYWETQMLSDGRLLHHWYSRIDHYRWGTFCN